MIVRRGMGGMGGELTDAVKNLGGQLGGQAGRVEAAITLAAVGSLLAAVFAGWAAWNTRR